MAILHLDQHNFHETIQHNDMVLVDFYADWCQPCRRIAPFIDEIAAEKEGSVVVCKVNVDGNQELAKEFSVMSIPYVMSFKNGRAHKRAVGAVPKNELLALLD